MSDSEQFSSDSSSEKSDLMSDSDAEDSRGHFVFKSSFQPYQGEPLAADSDMGNDGYGNEEEPDEDGILPSVLEQRFDGNLPVNEW